jgi:hypothetical protein
MVATDLASSGLRAQAPGIAGQVTAHLCGGERMPWSRAGRRPGIGTTPATWSARAAELPETKAPPRERGGQLVGVTGAQRLQQHGPSPVATCPRRPFAAFRLDRTPAAPTLEGFDEQRPHQTTFLRSVPEGSPHDLAQWQRPARPGAGGRASTHAAAAHPGLPRARPVWPHGRAPYLAQLAFGARSVARPPPAAPAPGGRLPAGPPLAARADAPAAGAARGLLALVSGWKCHPASGLRRIPTGGPIFSIFS